MEESKVVLPGSLGASDGGVGIFANATPHSILVML